jgi:ABC-type transport system involved in multi-copper enzyme maturation permease subunit
MLRRMIVKEWKEKFGLVIFALVGLLLFSLASIGYSKELDTLDILVSTLLFIFLPAFSLLLGASGFASEFQDGAWAYLFSRPVKKWRIWLAKYFSLLTVLCSVTFLFDLLIRFHPALKSANDRFSFSLLGDLSHGLLLYLLPLLFFTTAFSLSVVSDRPYSVVFVAALIWIALQMAMTRVIGPLLYRGVLYPAVSAIPIVFVLLPLSFALASLITLNRADFSQPRSRAWTFTKSAAIIFPVFIVLLALFTLGVWKARSERYFYDIEARADAFYFATDKGVFKFDAASGRTEKTARFRTMWGQISQGGDKVAFVTYPFSGKRRASMELRIVKTNGTEERTLVETWDKESPLYGGHIYPIGVSPQGDKVAFIMSSLPKKTSEDLWVINSDGSGLRGYELDIPESEFYLNIGFENSGQSLFLLCTMKIKPGGKGRPSGAVLLRMNLETGRVEILADQIRKPYVASMARAGLTSGAGLLAYIHYDEAMSKEILTVLDPGTLEKRQVYLEDSVTGFRWNAAGDELVFLTAGSKLGIYSLAEKKVVKIAELKGYDLRWPSGGLEWTQDGRILVRRMEKWEVSFICLLDANLTEQIAIRLPFSTSYAANIWSAGKYAIVENTERHQLWGLDLATEKWTRIY